MAKTQDESTYYARELYMNFLQKRQDLGLRETKDVVQPVGLIMLARDANGDIAVYYNGANDIFAAIVSLLQRINFEMGKLIKERQRHDTKKAV